jgi:NAD(P)-dependent dehydrogenase (short-subunit alcohol dehydrogenase family)
MNSEVNYELENKRVLVTGSTGGIGEGIAKLFAELGASVIIHGRNGEEAERLATEIKNSGGKATIVLGDLSQDEEVERIVETATKELGGVDILVNNAGGGSHQDDMNTPPAEWLDSYNVNLVSMVRLIQKLLPQMREKGWGRIINISSAAGFFPQPGQAAYSTTKSAVNNLTVAIAQSLNADGVTINTVSPGVIITPKMIERAKVQGMGETLEEIDAACAQMMKPPPLVRMGRVDDIANVVVFLASPLASYVHGANIRVDGGLIPTVN